MDDANHRDFDWYSLAEPESPLQQGDLINDFPIPQFSSEFINAENNQLVPTQIINFDVIVLSQTCDLLNFQDDDDVMLCPRADYLEADGFQNQDMWNKLVRGNLVSSHLLNRCSIEGFVFEFQIVNLKKIYPVPFGYVNRIVRSAGRRVRLLPPYREYLAQAFARQFMRIGLPIDLPRDYPY